MLQPNTVRIKALLSTMIKVNEPKEVLITNFYNEVIEEFKFIKFVAPDNLLDYDKVYKDFIIATMKNFLYEQSEENKNSVLKLIDFLQSFKVVGE